MWQHQPTIFAPEIASAWKLSVAEPKEKFKDPKGDIFSMGIVFYALATQKEMVRTLKECSAGKLPSDNFPKNILGFFGIGHSKLKPIVGSCLQVNPQDRPNAKELSRQITAYSC